MSILNKLFSVKNAESLQTEGSPSLVTPQKPSKAWLIACIGFAISSLALGAFAYKQSTTIQKINKELTTKTEEAKQLQEKLSQLETEIPKTNSANDVLKSANSDLQNVAQALALQLASKPSSKTVFKE